MLVGVPSLAVFGVAVAQSILAAVDVRLLGLVALANLVGRGVRGQRVGISSIGVGPVASEESTETTAAVAGGVVVGG